MNAFRDTMAPLLPLLFPCPIPGCRESQHHIARTPKWPRGEPGRHSTEASSEQLSDFTSPPAPASHQAPTERGTAGPLHSQARLTRQKPRARRAQLQG